MYLWLFFILLPSGAIGKCVTAIAPATSMRKRRHHTEGAKKWEVPPFFLYSAWLFYQPRRTAARLLRLQLSMRHPMLRKDGTDATRD